MAASLQLFGVMMAVMAPVILIIFISEYFKYKKNTAEKMARMNREIHDNSTKELEKEVADLRERIQVLEEIVTDRRYDLDRKISNL